MTPQFDPDRVHVQRLRQIFEAALEVEPPARERYLSDTCAGNLELEREVLRLLQGHEQPMDLLEEPAILRLKPDELDTDMGLPVGSIVGERFEISALLGRGGMGIVHLAERVDGEVSQRVAVKLLKPGTDDAWVRERFLGERQILAAISHPNIARLLDAGHREDGQPYLVMEYVDGTAIDVYTSGFGIRKKVALFLKVCSAAGYLHRNLVVHRDLKPSNILVTSEGEPKLLDFGIAKALDVSIDSTMTGMRMLTPDYASPEQVAGGPVSTATDIYSLGAVLYRLLTGQSPHQFPNNSAVAIASTILTGEITPPGNLEPDLKGDLEMILTKALRKEPQERYLTVDQFSEDLENYLESRPISARKGDTWYRTRKFLQRYWLPLSAAAVTVAGLSTGLLIANYERSIAQRRFIQVRQVSNKLFEIDAEVRQLPGGSKTRQLIVDTSLDYLGRLTPEARGDFELALDLGTAYMRVARVQGVPISPNLGQGAQAEKNLRIAETLIRSVLVAQPGNRTALLRMAQISHDRMILPRLRPIDGEALKLAQDSTAWLEKYLKTGTVDRAEVEAVLIVSNNVANLYRRAEQFDDALRLCRRAIGIASSMNRPLQVGGLLMNTAMIHRDRAELDEALHDIQEAVRILEPVPAIGDGDQVRALQFALALTREGMILADETGVSQGRPAEAIPPLDRAFRIAETYARQDPHDSYSRERLFSAGTNLASIVADSDPRRAVDIYDHILRRVAEIDNNPRFRRNEVTALSESTYPLRSLGRASEAHQRLDAAFSRLRQLKLYPSNRIDLGSETDDTLRALAAYEVGNGNLVRAAEIYRDLLDHVLASQPKPETSLSDAVDLSNVYAALAVLERRSGRAEFASSLEAQRLQLWRNWDAKLPHNSFVRRQFEASFVRQIENGFRPSRR
jgi:tRNA A-37 threonylcarbamoyl transferase component Bud32/tetratricopeptide (TPR) repeat protein